MQKYDVQMALETVREATQKWRVARRDFNLRKNKVLDRLLHEAAVNHMSAGEVASLAGMRRSEVTARMTDLGMDGAMRKSKTLLAEHAAKALAENSELLGMAPHQMDLMSPLAYLPAGSELRQKITDATTAGVTELEEDCHPHSLPIEVSNEVAKIIAEETSCGYCEGECPACQETAQRIIGLVMGMLQ